MGLTPAPVYAWPLAWVALALLWWLVVNAAEQETQRDRASLLQAIAYGLAWGFGYHGLALFWITGIHPMTWMGVPWLNSLAIAAFCWIFISSWGALLTATWASAMVAWCRWDCQRLASVPPAKRPLPWLRVLVGVALWCAIEALWSRGPLYWTSISYTQSPYNLVIAHLAQFSGPSAVTAALVVVNGLLAEAGLRWRLLSMVGTAKLEKDRARSQPVRLFPAAWLASALILLIVLHGLGWNLYRQPLADKPNAALDIGIIQGNVPNEIKLYGSGLRRALAGYTRGYEALAAQGVDAVLTPETAIPLVWHEVVQARSPFYQTILERQVPVWVGAFGRNFVTNSLFTVLGNGNTFSRYDKVKLVPVGEYIPLSQWLGDLIDRLSPLDVQMVPGSPTQVFETPFGRAIAAICYESAFSHLFRDQAAQGGQFILSASNDAHYSETMPAQHHAQDILRAIETSRWTARATNTGYSAIVDPHGQTRWISPINEYALHATTIYRRQNQTLYVRWGDWLMPSLLGLGLLGTIIRWRR